MTLPTFIIAGASKSGSTSLWMYLKKHPQVCITPYRATRFFTQDLGYFDGGDESGPLLSGRYSKGVKWYESLFRDCIGADAIGEITLSYMSTSDSPGLIHQTIPDVRLLFILRNPVDRIYSHYWEERKGGLNLPDFKTLVETEHPRFRRYLYVSSYHLHLALYNDIFPPEQIFVFLFDDLQEDTRNLVNRIYQAIGVDSNFVPPNIDTRFNPAGLNRIDLIQRWMNSSIIQKLSTEMPLWLYKFLGSIRQRVINFNTVTTRYPPMEPEIREKLISELDSSITFVEQYLDRPIPSWRMG